MVEAKTLDANAARVAVDAGIVGEECLFPTSSRTDEVRNAMRARCIDSLYFLAKGVLGFKDMTPELHGWMANWIQSDVNRLLMLVPRGHFKSSLGSIAAPVHELINDLPRNVPEDLRLLPECNDRILLTNASEDLVCRFLGRIKGVWERNETFRWLFPETIPDFNKTVWSGDAMLLRRSGEYPEPSIKVVGVKGKITGWHGNRQVWDDLIEREAAESETVMEKAIDFFKTTVSLFDDPEHDIGRMYGTLWTNDDLYKHVKDNLPYDPATGYGFKYIVRQAIEKEKPIFPDRFSLAYLAQIQKEQGHRKFALQYMNNPSDPTLQEFNPDLLRTYTVDPQSGKITFSALNPASGREETQTILPSQMDRVGLVDPALGEKKRKMSDRAAPAIVLTGTAEIFGSMAVFVLFSWTGQIHTGKQLDKIYETNKIFRPRGWAIEPAAFQRSLKRWVEERNSEGKYGYVNYLDVPARTRQSKEDFMRGLLPYLNHRRIYIPEGSFELVKQLTNAPYGRPIDIMDALALGLHVWRNPGTIDAEEDAEREEIEMDTLRDRTVGRAGY